MVVNKQPAFQTEQIENELRRYLPQINVESDAAADGDVVFRTNQQPDEQFIGALRQLDQLQTKNLVKNYGVQNSTMDDVFLKISREAKGRNESGETLDMERIGLSSITPRKRRMHVSLLQMINVDMSSKTPNFSKVQTIILVNCMV